MDISLIKLESMLVENANVDVELVESADPIVDKLIKQVSKPVRFQQTLEKILTLGRYTFVEVGPSKVLSGLLKKLTPEAEVHVTDTKEDLERTLEVLGGSSVR